MEPQEGKPAQMERKILIHLLLPQGQRDTGESAGERSLAENNQEKTEPGRAAAPSGGRR